jgi:tetratricopeptide (TPR) repeat protein
MGRRRDILAMARKSCLVLIGSVALVALGGCRKSADAHLHQARQAAYRKDFQAALRQYRLALDVLDRGDSPLTQSLRARALRGIADTYYLELRDIPRAAEAYRDLIQSCPESVESVEAHVHLANLLKDHYRDVRGAVSELSSAVARRPAQSAELSYQIAKLYFQLANYPQCVLEADALLERYGDSEFADDAMLLKAQALTMIDNKRPEAIQVLQKLLARFPDSELQPHALFELGKLHEEAHQEEKAIDCWVEALQRHPDPGAVQAAIARVRRRIENTTPRRVGSQSSAFDRLHARARPRPLPVPHASEAPKEKPGESSD